MSKLKIMIIDDEPDLRELIIFFIMENFAADFAEFADGNSAVEYLGELLKKGESPHLCICDMNMPNGNGKVVYDYIRKNFPTLPYILSTSDQWDRFPQMQSPYTGYIQKPFGEKAIKSEVDRLALAQVPTDEKPTGYIGISIDLLTSISLINCFLYLKISEATYIKVILPGTTFDIKFRQEYERKKVTHLYVTRTDFSKVIHDFVERINTRILLKEYAADSWQQIQLAENIIEVLNQAIVVFQWSEPTEKLVKQNIGLILSYINHNYKIREVFAQIKNAKSNYLILHSLLISIFTSAIIKEISGTETDSINLTLAAFFHDVSLDSPIAEKESRIQKELLLQRSSNKEDEYIILGHPQASFDIVNKFNYFPTKAKQIILSHHERPSGNGFPNKLKAEEIDFLTSIFIVAEGLAVIFLTNNNLQEAKIKWDQILPEYNYPNFKVPCEIITQWLS